MFYFYLDVTISVLPTNGDAAGYVYLVMHRKGERVWSGPCKADKDSVSKWAKLNYRKQDKK